MNTVFVALLPLLKKIFLCVTETTGKKNKL